MTSVGHSAAEIPGYSFGVAGTAQSPVSAEDLEQLEQTTGWTAEDARLLERYAPLFQRHAEKMVWMRGAL